MHEHYLKAAATIRSCVLLSTPYAWIILIMDSFQQRHTNNRNVCSDKPGQPGTILGFSLN